MPIWRQAGCRLGRRWVVGLMLAATALVVLGIYLLWFAAGRFQKRVGKPPFTMATS
jgi:hypothetical protein